MLVFINQESDVRLDRFVRRHYPFIPQYVIEKDIRLNKIKVNGQKKKSSYRLLINDTVKFFSDYSVYEKEQKKEYFFSKKDKAFLDSIIIYEDDDICLINKPCDLAVQGGTGIAKNLDDLLKGYAPQNSYKLMHRLDKGTSGLIVFAKNQQAAKEIAFSFKKREIEKTYLAVVHGKFLEKKGILNYPLLKDFKNNKEKMIVSPNGDEAITQYEVLAEVDGYSLLQIKPLTGRTHQIRVHLSHINHPIVGDYKYGSYVANGKRLHLHAQRIAFDYGQDKKRTMCFYAPIVEKEYFSLFQEEVLVQ